MNSAGRIEKIFLLKSLLRNWKALSCVWLCDPMDCSLPGSSVLEILQARILEWVAVAFPTQGLNPGLPHCRQILYHLSQEGGPYFQSIAIRKWFKVSCNPTAWKVVVRTWTCEVKKKWRAVAFFSLPNGFVFSLIGSGREEGRKQGEKRWNLMPQWIAKVLILYLSS